ncbi:hypothetical protein HY485_03290 [Candidatus Woesearchaeota archaeon]|nr:hypothetical protein [Candidatus Woesearchaeota archaeon]
MHKEHIATYGLFIVVFIILTFLFFLNPTKTITGSSVIQPQFSVHKQYLNLELFEQQSMLKTTIKLDDLKQPFFLKDIKLTGKGTGFFRIWLQTPAGRRFLLLNSNSMKKKIPLTGSYEAFFQDKPFVAQITGFAVKDNKKNDPGNQGQGNNDNKANDNPGKGNDDKENKGKNKENSETPQNRAKLERKLEMIYGPSWLTPAEKQALKRATEPEKLFETIKFENVCVTCSLPDGVMETQHDLLIEIDGFLEIKEIDYTTEHLGKN